LVPSVQEVCNLLDKVNKSPAGPEEISAADCGWTFARPATRIPFQGGERYIISCKELLEGLKKNIQESKDRGHARPGLVFATLGCAGSGKSRLCDEFGHLLFPNTRSVLLKVSYNIVSQSELDREFPLKAFLWRIVASAYNQSHPFPAAYVSRFLSEVQFQNWDMNFDIMYNILKELLDGSLPWVLVVDEIIKASGRHEIPEILSACSQFVRQSTSDVLRCVFITSFIPSTLNDLSISGRPPLYLDQQLLTIDSCFEIAACYGFSDPRSDLKVLSTIRSSGGHPRSLCLGLEYLKRNHSCIVLSELAHRLSNFSGTSLTTNDVVTVFELSFQTYKFSQLPTDVQELMKYGRVQFTVDQVGDDPVGWVSIPPPLIGRAIIDGMKQKEEPFCSMFSLLQQPESTAEKCFECCVTTFDLIKAHFLLPVVPPLLHVVSPPADTHINWHTLRHDFDTTTTDSVFFVRKRRVVFNSEFDLHKRQRVVCQSVTHPYIESMFDAKFPDGSRVKVLHQVKISNTFAEALKALNKAAKLLQDAGWDGKFLLIIVIGEIVSWDQECEYPTLLVSPDQYNSYFSPSFAFPIAIQQLIHAASKKAK